MRFPLRPFSAALLVATLAFGAAPAPSQQLATAAAYKVLTGDDLPTSDPPPLAIGAWAGGTPGTFAVATLDGDDGASDLGSLRVGLLARQGAAWRLLASNDDSGEPDLKRTIEPSTAAVRIDSAAFRIAPREVAVAVDITESLTTTSISAEASSLHLYRRFGAKLVPIFSTPTEDATIDKTVGGHDADRRWIVRFTPHLTLGFYDLVVQQRGREGGRTFAWNGRHYAPVRR